ncbi:MAG TPA: CmcJ/NvfI family oxidoreductase, partial [Gemmatimonadales bacterium]|nr:CmcJ/NvfI family oxidoreductase [Gemmatimonadales bacterium]
MVESTLNYLADLAEKPYFYLYEPPPGTPWRNTKGDRRSVAIHDARELVPPPALDEEGFSLVSHETSVQNLYDPNAVRDLYYREVEELVRKLTGATRVLAFDHNVRSASEAQRRESGAQPPV